MQLNESDNGEIMWWKKKKSANNCTWSSFGAYPLLISMQKWICSRDTFIRIVFPFVFTDLKAPFSGLRSNNNITFAGNKKKHY